jgi:hypothetical protein
MHCRLPVLSEKATSMARFAIYFEEDAPNNG